MKKFIFLIVLAIGAWCWGAMTRDQVCIEQNGWNQANNEFGERRGFNVWTPFGKNSDEWVCWQNVLEVAVKDYRFIISATGLDEGDTFTLTIGAVNITATADATPTASEIAIALAAAWEASADPLCTPILATSVAGSGSVHLKGVPGVDFTVTGASVGGTITPSTQQAAGATPQTYSCFGAFKAKIKAGYYMALNKSIVNTSAGPIWYPTPAAGTWGEGVDVTNSAAWTNSTELYPTNFMGFCGMYTATATRTLSLKVPSGTTRLYLLGAAHAVVSGTRTCAIASKSGDEAKHTIVDSVVDFSATGDLIAYGEQAYYPFYEINEGSPHYQSVALIATNFTEDSTIVITPTTAATNACLITGFIAINDSSTAQPDTGVFDPTTVEYIMPSSYDSAGTQNYYGQYAEGPLYLKINAGTPTFWGNGHWAGTSGTDVLNTLTSPASSIYYDKTLFSYISGTTYTPTQTENAWVRYVADSVTSSTSGVIDVDDGTTNASGVGTYRAIRQWTSSGMSVSQKWAFDADAETAVLKLAVSAMNGGYVAQWSLDNQFTQYLRLPLDTTKQASGTIPDDTDTQAFASNVTAITMFDPTHSITALFNCGFSYYDSSTSSAILKPILNLTRRYLGDGFYKIYLQPVEDSPDEDIAIADGDEIYSYQTRILTNTNGLEAKYGTGWLK